MPTLTELKAEMERALNDPQLKAEIYARPLRKAGLLTTGGRGPSAPQMTERDCANLLIAIIGNAAAIRGPETVKQYRSLHMLRRRPGPRGHRSTRPRKVKDLSSLPLARIREAHFFGELVELLILRAADGSIKRLASKWKGGPGKSGLSLRLIGPRPAALLRMPMLDENMILSYAGEDQTPPTPSAGLVRAMEVHEDVLIALGALFRRGGRDST